jgi:murein DD-endopeptidase MepM/ murein hydrolase activator NlpD
MRNEEIIMAFKNQQHEFHPVVPFDPSTEKLISLDFTANNLELSDDILNDATKFTSYINNKLKTANAKYGIGGYAEHRTVYTISKLFDADKTGEEPRRLHLGIDIWGKPYTKVMAPLDAIVHSYAFNDGFGNYGVTVILSHSLHGFIFYTLYGHLSWSSIKNIHEGDRVLKGDVFAEFGIPVENGHWPPHLHFQVLIDMQNWKGDYPGVCKFSEREKYLNNCPDPDLILQMMKYTL